MIGFYKNGNYVVTVLPDGTKIRKTEEDEFIPAFAENCDIKITDKCDGGCNFCLIDSTLIKTSEGEKKIKEIKKDDVVFSMDAFNGELNLNRVVETYERYYEGDLIKIEVENGEFILCTPNHKIFTLNRGYVPAEEITINDEVLFF